MGLICAHLNIPMLALLVTLRDTCVNSLSMSSGLQLKWPPLVQACPLCADARIM